jgi:anaerobic selenocysteine-containing dehydrogenase
MRELVSGSKITDEAAALVQLRTRMVTPRGEARSDYEIVFDLVCRLGMADDFFGGNIEAGWNYMLEPLGLTATTRSS